MTKIIQNTIFKFLTLLFCLISLNGCAVQLFSRIPVHAPKETWVKTEEGWRLPVVRYRPRTLNPEDPVILLVSSPHTNAQFWTLEPSVNLPMYLALKGWDVWTFSFRGTAKSKGKRQNEIKFEDYYQKDLPAVIAEIKKVTKTKQLIVLGHSFGGTLLVNYLIQNPSPSVDAAIFAATPFKFHLPLSDCFYLDMNQETFNKYFFDQNEIERDVEQRYAILAEEKLPASITQYFKNIPAIEGMEQDVSSIKIPVLFLSGKKDDLAPTMDMLWLYRNVGSTDKSFREFGKSNFYKINYDHPDLILSRYAQKEVYPYIYEWLRKKNN